MKKTLSILLAIFVLVSSLGLASVNAADTFLDIYTGQSALAEIPKIPTDGTELVMQADWYDVGEKGVAWDTVIEETKETGYRTDSLIPEHSGGYQIILIPLTATEAVENTVSVNFTVKAPKSGTYVFKSNSMMGVQTTYAIAVDGEPTVIAQPVPAPVELNVYERELAEVHLNAGTHVVTFSFTVTSNEWYAYAIQNFKFACKELDYAGIPYGGGEGFEIRNSWINQFPLGFFDTVEAGDEAAAGITYNIGHESAHSYSNRGVFPGNVYGPIWGGENNTGTWANYTLNVVDAGWYEVKFLFYLSWEQDEFFIQLDDGEVVNSKLAVQGDPNSMATAERSLGTIYIPEGIHVLKVGSNSSTNYAYTQNLRLYAVDEFIAQYKGTAYSEALTTIPADGSKTGNISFEYYDMGGLGVACGTSAELADPTAARPIPTDQGAYMYFETPNKWFNYTVTAPAAGIYIMKGHMLSNGDGKYFVKVNGEYVSPVDEVTAPSTSTQWVNDYPIATLKLNAGKNVITFGTTTGSTILRGYYFTLQRLVSPTNYWYTNTVSDTQSLDLWATRFDMGGAYNAETNPYGGYSFQHPDASTSRCEEASVAGYVLDGSQIVMYGGDFVNYTVNAEKAGWYDATMTKWVAADVHPSVGIYVNGVKQLSTETTGAQKEDSLGKIYLPEGKSTIKIATSGTVAIWQKVNLAYSADQSKAMVDISITDKDGVALGSLDGVSEVNVSFNAYSDIDAVIGLAIYENGKLLGFKSKPVERTTDSFAEAVTFTKTDGNTYTAKAFVWDGLGTLAPVTAAISLN